MVSADGQLTVEIADVLRVGHMSGGGRAVPPADPYGAVPIESIARRSTYVSADSARLLPLMTGGTQDLAELRHPSEHIQILAAKAAAGLPSSADLSVPVPVSGYVAEFDFGHLVSGHLHVRMLAPEGTILHFDMREFPVGHGPGQRHGVRYVTRGREDTFVTQESHGFRYLAV